MKHKLIVIEGLDYSGKTTLVKALKAKLPSSDFGFYHEPHGILGEFIRQHGASFDSLTKSMLFATARREFVKTILLPELSKRHIILDRFTASTLAYQIAGDGSNVSTVETLNELATLGLSYIDSTIYLDMTVEEMRARQQFRDKQDDLDLYKDEYYQRVRESYPKACMETSDDVHIINATLLPEEVENVALNIIDDVINKN